MRFGLVVSAAVTAYAVPAYHSQRPKVKELSAVGLGVSRL
jgi:hypothetical protein